MSKDLIKKLSDDSFNTQISQGVTLVDFFADWCGPCRMLAPILEKVAVEVQGKAVVAKIDIDHSEKIAATYQITSVPTLILFKDGKEVGRIVGLRDAEALKSFVLSAK